jgi:hypothetical protein
MSSPAFRIRKIKKMAKERIDSVDKQATDLLTSIGSILALAGLARAVTTTQACTLSQLIWYVSYCTLSALGCAASACCLWPRMNRKQARLCNDGAGVSEARAKTFLADLVALNAEDMGDVLSCARPGDAHRNELAQAMFLAHVASWKLIFFKLSVALFSAALVALIAALFSLLAAL